MSYSLSFTAGALLFDESTIVINSIENIENYYSGNIILDKNVLITNAESSRKRLVIEIDNRLKRLNADYLLYYSNSINTQDQKIILFLSICKLYSIITEFSLEVVYKKWINSDYELTPYDFKYFLSSKLDEEKLNSISESSFYKLSQVAIKIFKDLGMLKNGKLEQITPSERLLKLLVSQNDIWFLDCILFNKNEILNGD